jgi:osmotically-inducible protein OsmY
MKTWTRCFMLAAAVSTVGGVAVASSVQKMQSNTFIEDSVRLKLAANQAVKGRSIQVAVANGFVTLTGCVASKSASSKATNLARSSAGVRSVTNKLRIGC